MLQSKFLPERIPLHQYIVRGHVKNSKRPAKHGQSLEPPSKIDLLTWMEFAERALKDFPFIGFQFSADAEGFNPGKDVFVLGMGGSFAFILFQTGAFRHRRRCQRSARDPVRRGRFC